jgi:hypothetical protein
LEAKAEEVEGMREPTTERSVQGVVNRATPGSRWRTLLMSIGFFCMLAALFIGASMKEAAGGIPRFLGLGAIALLVISGIWALLERLSCKREP